MNLTRGPFYDDHEPFLAERLNGADVIALDAQEDGWVDQAKAAMPADRFDAAMSQWYGWKTESPAYRILAYNDAFGGHHDEVPEILTVATGWQPDDYPDAVMIGLFAKADDAIANGSSAPGSSATGTHLEVNKTADGSPASAFGSTGILIAAAAALWFLSRKK